MTEPVSVLILLSSQVLDGQGLVRAGGLPRDEVPLPVRLHQLVRQPAHLRRLQLAPLRRRRQRSPPLQGEGLSPTLGHRARPTPRSQRMGE